MATVAALDAGSFALSAEGIVAVIGTGRHIPLAVPIPADPELREDIPSPPEEGAEQDDLFG